MCGKVDEEILTSKTFSKVYNGKVVLCLIKRHTLKTCEVLDIQLHPFLNSALDIGDWSVSSLNHFTPD